jgi:hypothetical protein
MDNVHNHPIADHGKALSTGFSCSVRFRPLRAAEFGD